LRKTLIIFIFLFSGLYTGELNAQHTGYAAIYGVNGFFETKDTLWTGNSDLTIEGYYSPCDLDNEANLFTIGDSLSGIQLKNNLDSFTLYIRNIPDNLDTSFLFTANSNFSEWNHFALIYKHSTTSLTIYINGQFARSIIITVPVCKGIRIGCSDEFDEYFRGRLDNYRFSSEAVYSGNFNPFSNTISIGQNTLAFWQFDSPGEDSIIFDASSFQKHLTVTGFTEFNYPLSDSLNFTKCGNDTIRLFVSGGDAYQWNPVDFLDDPGSASPLAYPPGNFVYQVEAISHYGCKPDTGTVIIKHFAKPDVKISTTKDSLCVGESTELTASGALYYLWSPVQFVDTVYKQTVVATPEETTDFILRGVDENSCIAFDTLTLFVDSCNNSLIEHQIADLLIYPNPSTGIINIKSSNMSDFQITIFTPAGKVVYNNPKASSQIQTELPDGLYIIQIRNDLQQVFTTKLLLQK
jgi:hypothetical protein